MMINKLLPISLFTVYLICLITSCKQFSESEERTSINHPYIADMPGLIAFWNFEHSEGDAWNSFYDSNTIDRSFPLYLRQIGDGKNYTPKDWPYTNPDSKLMYDKSGPFGKAVRFNKGYIYGFVPRKDFDRTLLDIQGKNPFSMVAWVKFVGKRHLVAGIWDEGGWHKYSGRRQVALFAGLFQQKGVIGHVSATGAASYPQSEIEGAQYARIRAIDGQAFENDEWIAMAMTYDPGKNQVKAYLNGEMTSLNLTDPVAQDVFHDSTIQVANPLLFEDPIYSPRNFVLKYNGYELINSGISEHRLQVNLENLSLLYVRKGLKQVVEKMISRILFDIKREGESILDSTLIIEAKHQQLINLPSILNILENDEVETSLEVWEDGTWKKLGTTITSIISEGAPFTFGRALGLASEELTHGSQLYLDGVAIFNRVLTEDELKAMSF